METKKSSKPDLVLTFAHGYAWKHLAVFFNSLRESGFSGDIVVFVSRVQEDAVEALNRIGVKVIPVSIPLFKVRNVLLLAGWWPWRGLFRLMGQSALRRTIAKRVFNIMCARFAFYQEYLEVNAGKYNKVLMADVRDVCFQSDPFSKIEGDQIVSFLEPIKLSGSNSLWLAQAYGDNYDKSILNEHVCCAGVTLGKASSVADYLDMMLEHLYHVVKMTPVAGVDQAVHNLILHTHLVQGSSMLKNGNPICMTMGNTDPFQLDEQGRVVSNGCPIAILHQYDRHSELNDIMVKKFGGPPAT